MCILCVLYFPKGLFPAQVRWAYLSLAESNFNLIFKHLYLTFQASSFSGWFFKCSAEQPCRNLCKICIFGARGIWPICLKATFRVTKGCGQFGHGYLTCNKRIFDQFGQGYLTCDKKSCFGQNKFAHVGATAARNISTVCDETVANHLSMHGHRKGGRGALAPPDFEIFSKKGCFFCFEWEKTKFTTFGHP